MGEFLEMKRQRRWREFERSRDRACDRAARTNLNQMAAVANSTGQLDAGLTGALGYVADTLRLHAEVLHAINPADPTRRPGP